MTWEQSIYAHHHPNAQLVQDAELYGWVLVWRDPPELGYEPNDDNSMPIYGVHALDDEGNACAAWYNPCFKRTYITQA